MSARSTRWAAIAVLAAYAIFCVSVFLLSDVNADREDGVIVLVGGAVFLLPLAFIAWHNPQAGWVFVGLGVLMVFFWLSVGSALAVVGLVLGGPLVAAGLLFRHAGTYERDRSTTTR